MRTKYLLYILLITIMSCSFEQNLNYDEKLIKLADIFSRITEHQLMHYKSPDVKIKYSIIRADWFKKRVTSKTKIALIHNGMLLYFSFKDISSVTMENNNLVFKTQKLKYIHWTSIGKENNHETDMSVIVSIYKIPLINHVDKKLVYKFIKTFEDLQKY